MQRDVWERSLRRKEDKRNDSRRENCPGTFEFCPGLKPFLFAFSTTLSPAQLAL